MHPISNRIASVSRHGWIESSLAGLMGWVGRVNRIGSANLVGPDSGWVISRIGWLAGSGPPGLVESVMSIGFVGSVGAVGLSLGHSIDPTKLTSAALPR